MFFLNIRKDHMVLAKIYQKMSEAIEGYALASQEGKGIVLLMHSLSVEGIHLQYI